MNDHPFSDVREWWESLSVAEKEIVMEEMKSMVKEEKNFVPECVVEKDR